MAHREKEGLAEHRDDVAEVTPPEFLFSPGSEPKDPGIVCEDAGVEHMIDDRGTHCLRNSVNNLTEPRLDFLSRNTAQLK